MAEIDMGMLANDLADMVCADIDAIESLCVELSRVQEERDELARAAMAVCGEWRRHVDYDPYELLGDDFLTALDRLESLATRGATP